MTARPEIARTGGVQMLVVATVAAAAALAIGLGNASGWGHNGWFVTILLATFLANRNLVQRRIAGQGWGWSLSDAVAVIGLFTLPGLSLVVAAAGGTLLAHLGRMPAIKVTFNAGQNGAAAGVASLTMLATASAGAPVAVCAAIAMIAYFLVNNTLVAMVVACATGQRMTSLVHDNLRALTVAWLTNTLVALAGVIVVGPAWTLSVIAVPLGASQLLHHLRVRDTDRERALTRLFDAASGSMLDSTSARRLVLEAALDAFPADRAQLIRADHGGTTTYELTPEHGEIFEWGTDAVSIALHLGAEPLPALAAVAFERAEGQALVAPVRGLPDDQPFFLVLRGSGEYAARFSRQDARTLRVFARKVGTVLAIAATTAGPRTSAEALTLVHRPFEDARELIVDMIRAGSGVRRSLQEAVAAYRSRPRLVPVTARTEVQAPILTSQAA